MTHMDYDVQRNPDEQPSLAEMTAKAIELLSSTEGEGFFLMIEGGRIDHACHNNDAEMLISEMLAFDKAVSVGLEYASGRDDTLVIVTADHETGGESMSPAERYSSAPMGTPRNQYFCLRRASVLNCLHLRLTILMWRS